MRIQHYLAKPNLTHLAPYRQIPFFITPCPSMHSIWTHRWENPKLGRHRAKLRFGLLQALVGNVSKAWKTIEKPSRGITKSSEQSELKPFPLQVLQAFCFQRSQTLPSLSSSGARTKSETTLTPRRDFAIFTASSMVSERTPSESLGERGSRDAIAVRLQVAYDSPSLRRAW